MSDAGMSAKEEARNRRLRLEFDLLLLEARKAVALMANAGAGYNESGLRIAIARIDGRAR